MKPIIVPTYKYKRALDRLYTCAKMTNKWAKGGRVRFPVSGERLLPTNEPKEEKTLDIKYLFASIDKDM